MKIQDLSREKLEATTGMTMVIKFRNGTPRWKTSDCELPVSKVKLVNGHIQQRYAHVNITDKTHSLGGGTEVNFR